MTLFIVSYRDHIKYPKKILHIVSEKYHLFMASTGGHK